MAGGFKKECRYRAKAVVLDHQGATMGGSGLRAHYVVEISVGDAFLDKSGGSSGLLYVFFPPCLCCFSVDVHGMVRVYSIS